MHLLYFGSFESILYPYVKYNLIADGIIASESDFIFHLLTAVDPYEYDGSPAAASRYKSGARAIPDGIVSLFHMPEARDLVVEHFRENTVSRIERGRQDQLIGDYINIIKQDTTIDESFKGELLKEATHDTISEFLSDLLIYSVSVDPKEKDKIYPAENYNLPAENDWFTGRSNELKALETGFREGARIQILYGMGGMGKSQIAQKYVYDHYRSYSMVHWINAHTPDSIADCYRDFLKAKGIPVDDGSQLDICQKYTRYLDARTDWLIVFDGCDHFRDEEYNWFAKYCIPKNPASGNIIITTRSNRPFGKAKRIEIDTLTKEDATAFLLQRTELSDLESAEKLAMRLCCFPLALELAGAYLRATPGINFKTYLSLLNKNLAILDEKIDLTDYDRTIKEIILLTLDRIKEDYGDDIAAIITKLLHLCSFCAPDHIDLRAFGFLIVKDQKCAVTLSEDDLMQFDQGDFQLIQEINDICLDDIKRNRISRLLIKYALMRADDNGLLSVHELQQEVIQNCFSPDNTASLTYAAFHNYCNQHEGIDWAYYYCMSHISAAINRITIEAAKDEKSQGRIVELNLMNCVQGLFTAVDKYRVIILMRATDDEMESAHNGIWEAASPIFDIITDIAEQDVAMHLFITAIEGFNHALSFFTAVSVFPSAFAFARFSLVTIFTAINKYGLQDIIEADYAAAQNDSDFHRGFVGDLLEDLKYCLSLCLFKGYYSEHIIPFLKGLPELLDSYAERAAWDEDTLSDYYDTMIAYVEKDPFLLPKSVQDNVSQKYGKPFSELAKAAVDKINLE